MSVPPTSYNPFSDIPYEDLRKTKDIVRLLMQDLNLLLREGTSLKEIHDIIKELKHEIRKFHDKILNDFIEKLGFLIDENWPLTEKTSMDILSQVKESFSYIDEKTLF